MTSNGRTYDEKMTSPILPVVVPTSRAKLIFSSLKASHMIQLVTPNTAKAQSAAIRRCSLSKLALPIGARVSMSPNNINTTIAPT